MGILRPPDNCWRIERASRAAVLIDAAAYFAAVRNALQQARHSVFIVGWDLDSRTKLAGESCSAEDGWPLTLREFLIHMVKERPTLTIYLLTWDFAILYALERDPFPSLKLGWQTPDQIRFRLDNVLPAGASHHQKIIVVDDALAFSGGLDLAVRRWDTSWHHLDDPHRCDPSGKPYPPFHDVQMAVDGDAARALAELVHERWQRATGEHIPLKPADDGPWPDVAPDFRETAVAIARTLPACNGQEEVREVEALFADMIASAEREIYIENQFLTCTAVAKALAQRLRANPHLQVLLVAPHTPENWFEYHTMRNGRIQFLRALQEPGVSERVRMMCPEIRSGERVAHTMVHSKVMIVDDRVLRVGSANLNNRSMGTDTECDLVIEAKSDAERSRIQHVRARLLADHCGVSVEEALRAVRARPHRGGRHALGTRTSSGPDRGRRTG